ncbi:MAG: hypothetical protein WA746_24815, partial [Isosphaeraceae bacterium]
LDGLPEIVGKFGRHGISQAGRWMIPVYPNRLMKARNSGREPSIGSHPEDDGLLGQLVDSLSPSKSDVDFRPKIEATPISSRRRLR